ncbi:MAG TPA: bifunctional oligoribonuclease/PAP phosphatase NrnA [Bacillota bacterium]|jgi:phosphoesterase RecJ-like protein|nr:bifunctional oligoribonuclease/PAP phosphatase NrnA [Bacillota bacterium]
MKNKLSNKGTIKKVAALLSDADSVLIFPHMQMDGDAMGASAALCGALRRQGKKADVLIEDKIPENLRFLDKGYCIQDYRNNKTDVCIALDCSDFLRIEKRQDIFKNGRQTVMIDHHTTSQPFADINYIDPSSSSTGEIVFLILKQMGVRIDPDAAEALFAAIATDTGGFLYSSTSEKTHLAVAELYKAGLNHNRAVVEIYQKKRIEKVKLISRILGTMEMIHGGKANLAVMTQQMLADTGAYPEETEGLVEELRNINGVEISAFLKEEEGAVRVTMRSKSRADVSAIAMEYGGGGHTKAAGCTIPGGIDEARQLIADSIGRQLDDLSRL